MTRRQPNPTPNEEPKPETPEEGSDLSKIYEEAYFDFNPDTSFGEGFESKLKANIAECGKRKDKELVVCETIEYVNYGGLYYYPTQSMYKDMKKWLIRNGLVAEFELSHSTLNLFAAKKTLQLKVYFNVVVAKPTTQ